MRKQQGIALVMVLWVSVLIAVLLASFSLSARVEALQGRNLLDATRARYAAEAGLHRAVYEMRSSNPELRWVADGRGRRRRDRDGQQLGPAGDGGSGRGARRIGRAA